MTLIHNIRESKNYRSDLSFVAVDDEQHIVGHIMLSHCEIVESKDSNDMVARVLTLSPLCVSVDSQKLGVGSALIKHSLDVARNSQENIVILEGSPDYYTKFGFVPLSTYSITMDLPSWAPPEAAMINVLASNIPVAKGHVKYPEAFGHLEH